MSVKTSYSDVFNIGVNRYNQAGCVTNIGYKGTGGYSRNLGLIWNSQYQLTAAYTNGSRRGHSLKGLSIEEKHPRKVLHNPS